MKYKIGDKVRVKSLEWYNSNKNEFGQIRCNEVYFQPTMSKICGSILTIKNIDRFLNAYQVEENSFYWSEDMFEENVEEDGIYDEEFVNAINTAYHACFDKYNEVPNKIGQVFISDKNYQDKVELCLGKDYEIVVEGDKTFVQRKKSKYPTTYEECCGVLGMTYDYPDIRGVSDKEFDLYSNFIQLIRCRDAYWKIALDKPWKQDYDDRCFIIANNNGNIHTYEYHGNNNVILAFPTEEMRDAFYRYFKEMIEKCKQLL